MEEVSEAFTVCWAVGNKLILLDFFLMGLIIAFEISKKKISNWIILILNLKLSLLRHNRKKNPIN